MTKAQLIASLDAMYKSVIPVECIETVGDVKKYLYFLLETGTGDLAGTPVAYKRHIPFYVWREGAGDEAAYYDQTSPQNSVNKGFAAVTPAAPTLSEIATAFNSQSLRARCVAAMLKASFSVLWEAPATANHTARMKWAVATQSSPNSRLDQCMSVLCVNATVLGGSPTDAEIENEINGYLDKWATTLYA